MTKQAIRPIIGLIPDYKLGGKDSYSASPFYAIRQNYAQSISKAGGAPIFLPYDNLAIDKYLNLIDGLLLVGGGFDINPRRYGQKIHPETELNKARDDFEFAVFAQMLQQKPKMPVLGICNGMQLINVAFGGDCIQHIPDHPQYINHEQSKNPEFMQAGKAYHDVTIAKNSQLFEIAQTENIRTNSSHHQAVGNLGKDIIVTAKAADGIIEAVEHQKHPFCLAVQWHPEFNTNEVDKKIFAAFIKASLTNLGKTQTK